MSNKDKKCPLTGVNGYPTKRECETAEGGEAKRCDHCRQWHQKKKKGRRH